MLHFQERKEPIVELFVPHDPGILYDTQSLDIHDQ